MILSQISKPKYDYIVIGAGSGGFAVARELGKLRKDCLLLSKNLGGNSTFTGCIPSNTFLNFAEFYRKTGDTGVSENIFNIVKDKVSIFHKLDQEQILDFDYFECKARFVSPKSIEVKDLAGNTKVVSFRKKCIIATGSKPKMVEIDGVGNERILNSDSILDLQKLPSSISIIGSGPVAVEYATGLAKFGVHVNLFVRNKLLSSEPREASRIIKESLQSLGVQIFEETSIKDVSENKINIRSLSGSEVSIPETEFYFEAIGRSPNISLNLESANVKYDQNGILVDRNLITSNRSVFAIGDCVGEGKFSHLAMNHAKWVVEKIKFPFIFRKFYKVPRVTFTDPIISSVGETGVNDQFTKKFGLKFETNVESIIKGKNNSFGLVYVNMLNGVIKGATLVGDGSEDLINFYNLICTRRISLFSLRNFITSYPTKLNSFDTLVNDFLKDFKTNWKKYYKLFVYKYKSELILLTCWLILFTTFYLYLLLTGNSWQNFVFKTLPNFLKSPFGMIAFVLVYILRAFTGISASLLTVVGAYIYGFIPGLLLSVLSSNLSSSINYFIGKFLGRNIHNRGNFLKSIFGQNDFFTILFARLAFFPYDLLSFISGFYKVSYLDFMKATIIGGLPGTIIISLIGASLNSKDFNFSYILGRFEYMFLGYIIVAVLVFATRYFANYKKT